MSVVNQAEYAAMHGVSRKTVTQWKSCGWLVFQDGKVDVEASDAQLKKYRRHAVGGVTSGVTQGGNNLQGKSDRANLLRVSYLLRILT